MTRYLSSHKTVTREAAYRGRYRLENGDWYWIGLQQRFSYKVNVRIFLTYIPRIQPTVLTDICSDCVGNNQYVWRINMTKTFICNICKRPISCNMTKDLHDINII